MTTTLSSAEKKKLSRLIGAFIASRDKLFEHINEQIEVIQEAIDEQPEGWSDTTAGQASYGLINELTSLGDQLEDIEIDADAVLQPTKVN